MRAARHGRLKKLGRRSSSPRHYDDPGLGRRIAHPDDLPLLEAAVVAPEQHHTVMIRWRHKNGLVFATEQRITPTEARWTRFEALEGIGRPSSRGSGSLQAPKRR